MNRLIIVFLSIMLSSVFAYADQHIPNLGKKATEFKDEGEKAHKREGMSHAASLILQRKMHPELLMHKRDKTLRQGVRGGYIQLKKCIECHTSVDENDEYIPINSADQFCSTCHQKVGISLDCFSCHRTTPSKEI
ncbi:Sulfite reduction-associated complex DsrMKJOP multiheme protein DsrJ (=HmeF) [uncultured Candidatus Thioglobus sp.]|nr:Sulfite reduction-associated complex DsrMKJOP multiheme protein DsrJ (=HmeF) [uncultured Candidatus Thioglobus sp.]